MKIDLKQHLKDPFGRPIKETAEGDPISIGTICINAMMAPVESDRQSSLAEKASIYKLATALAGADGEIELSPEDVSKIRERINQAFPSPILVGAASSALGGV